MLGVEEFKPQVRETKKLPPFRKGSWSNIEGFMNSMPFRLSD